jgi:arylsulfatase A
MTAKRYRPSHRLAARILAGLTACLPLWASAAPPPNFVLIVSDDQDWNGLSVRMHPDIPGSRSDFYRTPNLEKFAAQAMRFSAGYAPAPVCSPTRISLQTGRNPAALRWTKAAPPETGQRLIEAENRKSIRSDEITIGEVLQRAGYATAHFGKWHLSGGGPALHGYHESDGDTGNHDADRHGDPNPVDIFGMTERAASFMKKHQQAGKPFFLQMSYHALHRPENALKATRAYYDRQTPGAMHHDPARAAITTDLDTGVGRLLSHLDELGLAATTYVVYMGDNGGGGGGGGKGQQARPLRAGKGGVWEGGIRVPFLVRGPGIPENSWCHQPVVGYDLFPTFCRLAGVEEKLPQNLDGGDLSSLFTGGHGPVERRSDALVFHFPHYQGDSPHSAIRKGDYKLIEFHETGSRMLFHLTTDLAERRDLAASESKLAEELTTQLHASLAAMNAAMPKPDPSYVGGSEPEPRRGKAGGKQKGKRP